MNPWSHTGVSDIGLGHTRSLRFLNSPTQSPYYAKSSMTLRTQQNRLERLTNQEESGELAHGRNASWYHFIAYFFGGAFLIQ